MMEDHEFCDTCPGCRPAIMNIATGKNVPDDDPMMVAVNKVWDNETTYAQRRAYIEVTLKNSEDQNFLRLANEVMAKIKSAIGAKA